MKTSLLKIALSTLFLSPYLIAESAHTANGTDYGQKGVVAYSKSNHGPDGSLFLDPYFMKDIQQVENKKILDAGCGSAPWAIYAAKHGGEVFGIDIQEGMIEAAKAAVEQANLKDKVHLLKGDVAALPYEDNFFDKEMSICVCCNLPSNIFERHIEECRRTLKKDGVAIIAAPISLDVVFSNGSKTEAEIHFHIDEVLSQLPDNPSSEMIEEKLMQLEGVLRATFYLSNNRLTLATKNLEEGTSIWRKLPTLVVPNRYYSKEHYVKAFQKNNLEIQQIDLPHFYSNEERLAYNEKVSTDCQLGKEYVSHAPFVIFHVRKK